MFQIIFLTLWLKWNFKTQLCSTHLTKLIIILGRSRFVCCSFTWRAQEYQGLKHKVVEEQDTVHWTEVIHSARLMKWKCLDTKEMKNSQGWRKVNIEYRKSSPRVIQGIERKLFSREKELVQTCVIDWSTFLPSIFQHHSSENKCWQKLFMCVWQ